MTKSGRLALRYGAMSSLLVGFLSVWLMTATGLNVTLKGLMYFMPGLRIEAASGCLIGPLHITRLSYHSKLFQATLEDFQIAFKRSDLLKGRLHIKELKVIRLNTQDQSRDSTMLDVWDFLQRVWIEKAEIKDCTFKTRDGSLKMDGAMGSGQKLQWALEGYGLKVKGELKAQGGQNPSMAFIAHSIPALLEGKKIPGLQITVNYQNAEWSSRIMTTDPEKPVNEISFRGFTRTPASFLRRALIELQLNIRCKDFSMLESFGVPVGDYPLTQASGPFTVDVTLKESAKQLKRYFKDVEYYLKGEYPYRPLPQQAALLIQWEDPHLLPWGVFKRFVVRGNMQRQRILWEAQATKLSELEKSTAPSQWTVKGETNYTLKKTKKPSSRFLSEKSLQALTRLKLNGEAFQFFSNTDYEFSASPDLNITLDSRKMHVSGELYIPQARLRLKDSPFTVKPDSDIYFVHSGQKQLSSFGVWDAQLTLHLGKNAYLNYGGLKARLGGSLALNKKEGRAMTAKGEVKIVEGGYYSMGQALNLEKHARLIFTERLYNPTLDIVASREIEIKPSNRTLPNLPFSIAKSRKDFGRYSTTDLKLPLKAKVGVHLRGDLASPSMHLFSKPLSWVTDPKDRLSYIMTGQPASHLGSNPLPLLFNTAFQLGQGYRRHHNVLHALRPVSVTLNREFEKGEASDRLIVSGQYRPEWMVLLKIGRWGTSHALGVHYYLGEHLTAGASVGLYQASHGCDISYQREWG